MNNNISKERRQKRQEKNVFLLSFHPLTHTTHKYRVENKNAIQTVRFVGVFEVEAVIYPIQSFRMGRLN